MGLQVLAEGGEFEAPGVKDFLFSDPDKIWVLNKAMVLVVVAAIIVAVFYLTATRRMKIVPNRFQFIAESFYDLGRNTIAREQIGSAEFRPFVPLILALFSFILVNNLFGIIPVIYFPSLSHIGFPLALSVLVVYPVYHFVGMRKHGVGGYLKNQLFPPNVPWPVYLLLTPIEFITKFVANPLTLALRVFAAMLAGHLLLLVFILGGEYLVVEASGWFIAPGIFSWVFALVITFLEVLVMAIQAYVFAVLSASYIGAALAEEH
ncbi:MAG: F0F1 ATP synthase subunit A [Actinophytocola sp.]|nr:F0F1 ATP synthase subunit A [Actinophytocola sp.]